MHFIFMKSRKRDRIDPDPDSTILVWWPPPDVLYHHVAPFLGDSFWDHWHFSQTTRSLWHYYREHDPCFLAMQRYLFDSYARTHESVEHRYRNVRNTGITRCLNWLWERESRKESAETLATHYMKSAAAKGNLTAIRQFAAYVQDGEERNKVLAHVMTQMAQGGHDSIMCRFFNQLAEWLPGWVISERMSIQLVLAAAPHVYRVPNFCTLGFATYLEKTGKDTCAVFATMLTAILGYSRHFDEMAFSFLWNQSPQYQSSAAYTICTGACTSIIQNGQNVNSTWVTIAARLPFIFARYLREPTMQSDDKNRAVWWEFPAAPQQPAVSFRCSAEKIVKEQREVLCRVSFGSREIGLLMTLNFQIPVELTPFEITD